MANRNICLSQGHPQVPGIEPVTQQDTSPCSEVGLSQGPLHTGEKKAQGREEHQSPSM